MVLCHLYYFWISGLLFRLISTRIIFFTQGFQLVSPIISSLIFIALCINFSVPPFIRVFSELIVIRSITYWSKFNIFILSFIIFISCYYCLILYSLTAHGKATLKRNSMIRDINISFFIIFMFFIVIFIVQISRL